MSGIYSLHMEPDAVTLRSSCFLSDRQRGGTVGVCDSVEQEPTVAHKHNSCTGGAGLRATLVAPWQPVAMFTQQQDVTTAAGDSTLFHPSNAGVVQTKRAASSCMFERLWAYFTVTFWPPGGIEDSRAWRRVRRVPPEQETGRRIWTTSSCASETLSRWRNPSLSVGRNTNSKLQITLSDSFLFI